MAIRRFVKTAKMRAEEMREAKKIMRRHGCDSLANCVVLLENMMYDRRSQF